ncbi:MAG: hypothetical protein ABL888_17185 [Pirellulaceae bacterium]
MLRFSIQFIALSLLAITFTLTVGCGPTQPPPVASRPAPKGVGGGEEGEDGTAAKAPSSAPKSGVFGAGEDSLASGEGQTDAANNEPEYKEIGGKTRRLPVASVGGGGAVARNKTKAAGDGGSSAAGMANGLFPVMSGGVGGSQTLVSGFGALFPTGSSAAGSSGTAATRPSSGSDAKTAAAEVKPAPKVETYLDRASKYFEQGDSADGHRALYAHMLMDKDAFEQFPLQSYKQVDEPRLFLNWGIGVHFSAPSDFSGIPPLIGDAASDSAPRAPSGSDDLGANPGQPISGPSTSSSKYGKVNADVPAGMLMFYGGDYAERLYKRLNDRRVNEYFGKIIAKMPERSPGSSDDSVAARAPVNAPRDPFAGRTRPVASGPGGEIFSSPPAGGDAGGDAGGKAGAGKSKTSTPLVQRWSVSAETKQPGNVTGMLLPGVVSVGEGSVESLVDRAKKLGLDVVVILDVKVNKDKRQFISANVIRLFDTDDSKKVLVQSRSLKNNQVAKDREKTRESNDPVEVELDKVFKDFVDVNLKAQALEGWDGNRATKYVETLVEKKVDKVRAATETLGLFRMGLLPADKCKSTLDTILDNSGTLLMAGKDSDKKTFLDDLLRSGGGSDDSSVR